MICGSRQFSSTASFVASCISRHIGAVVGAEKSRLYVEASVDLFGPITALVGGANSAARLRPATARFAQCQEQAKGFRASTRFEV